MINKKRAQASVLTNNQVKKSCNRRYFLQSAGICTAACILNPLISKTLAYPHLKKAFLHYPQTPLAGQLLFGTADSGAPMHGVQDFEKALQANGADPGFRFGCIRSYLTYNANLDKKLIPYTAKSQGPSGHQYIPLISLRTRITGQQHVKYPDVWAGVNDANWKKQFDQIAAEYGTKNLPVNGPAGKKAYPVILTFNHEMDLGSESGAAFDRSHALSNGQQYAKAFRYVQDLQRTYQPGLNIRWTWLPTVYSIKKYTGTAMNPVFEFWPSRKPDGANGAIDDGTPDLKDVSRIDIIGCDAYMNDFSFHDAVNFGGINAKSSFVNMANSVGVKGLPWLIGEWGIDERCNDANWKKETFDIMMKDLDSPVYRNCVAIMMWGTGSPRNDNRWNSPPKTADGNCDYPWGQTDNQGVSARAFTAHLAKGVALPGGRPNVFDL